MSLPVLSGFIGSSSAAKRIISRLPGIAASGVPVLIAGESGTGKDMVAQAIHALSAARDGPFVTLNASAVPDDILDRELHGGPPDRQAAYPAVPRYLESAQRGTLYIDDVCRMSPVLQARLVHLLQARQYIDGNGRPRPFAARLIAASNMPLTECLKDHRFQRDLFDRIAVEVLTLPPLRERGGDAVEIARRVYPRIRAELGLPPAELDDCLLARIAAQGWPGNVRQLLNTLRRMALAGDLPAGQGQDLPPELLGEIVYDPGSERPPRRLVEIEQQAIYEAIRRNRGSIQRAAEELDMAPSTIYRKLKSWQRS